MKKSNKKFLQKIARKVIANKSIRSWVICHIKNGRGYSDPTDLFDGAPKSIPKSYRKYFEGGNIDFDSAESKAEYIALEDKQDQLRKTDPEFECLYSVNGAIALMDAAIEYVPKKMGS